MGQSKLEIAITALNQASADIEKLKESLKNATTAQEDHNKKVKESSEITKQAKEGLNGMVESVTGLNLAQLSLAGVMVAGVELMKKSIEMTVELGEKTENFMNITGATAEQASSLLGVFNILGISSETLTRALEAAVRKGYQPSIEGLQAMRAEYNAIQSPIDRTKYLMDTFGRSGAQMAEYFKASDATLSHLNYTVQQSGKMMKEDGVEAAQQYGRQVKMLDDQWQGILVTVGGKVIPVLSDLLQSTNNQSEAEKMLIGVHISDGERMRQLAILTEALTNAQKDNVQEEGLVKMATEASRLATDNMKNSTDQLNNSTGAAKSGWAALPPSIRAYISATDDASAATHTYGERAQAARVKLAEFAQSLADHRMTVEEYNSAVAALGASLNTISDRHATITVDYYTHMHSDNQGGYTTEEPGTAHDKVYNPSTYAPSAPSPTAPNAPALPPKASGYSPSAPRKAIGGRVGAGQWMVGDQGPELLNLDPGSSGNVTNNYETNNNYNLTAHYPTYQNQSQARDDLMMLTMLKNTGAAKWAPR